ncbi:MAG: PGF-pre-PGF domain-containing protein [Methanosarcina sp.]
MNITEVFRAKNWIRFSRFISGIALIFLLAGTIIPTSAAGIGASREISAGTVCPGENFTVTVHIGADQDVEALTLDENLPDGWHVIRIGNNRDTFQEISTFKESTLEWIWAENFSAGEEKTIIYNVTVPSNFKPGNFTISGTISAYSIPTVPVEGFSEIVVTYLSSEADFSAIPLLGSVPLTVQFTDLSAFNPDFREWDFDGNENIDSNERNPVYTYVNPGTYNVTFRVTNSTYGNDTRTKTGYITALEKPSGSEEGEGISGGGNGGESGGGGGAGSPESSRNIELKEISNEQVFKGTHTCFTFKGGANEIVTVEFDPKKNFGKTTAIVEMLKNTSSIVKEPAPGMVYKNVNIWVGNSGFSNPENLENARVSFRVSRAWVAEQGISENTVTLYRYGQDAWNQLSTALSGEDEAYFYFTAETPGFSSFAISSTEKSIQSVEISTAKKGENQTLNEDKTSDKVKNGIYASDLEKEETKSSPGLGTAFAGAELLILYGILKRKK